MTIDPIPAHPAPCRYTTILSDFTVPVSIGIHERERQAAQAIVLNIWLHAAYPAAVTDDIAAVVDYDFLRTEILDLVAGRHFELQETLCDEIARLALADGRVTGVRVRSMKPDIYPDAAIGCEIVRERREAVGTI